jgi:hypothetical protein
MMTLKNLILTAVMMVFALGLSTAIGAQESDDAMCLPTHTVISPPEEVEAKRDAVPFPHSNHFSIECKDCHHKWDRRTSIQNCTTAGCHDAKKSLKDRDQAHRYYKNAYHKMCIGCHRDMKKKNREMIDSQKVLEKELPKTGPTGCKDCHVGE